MIVEKNTSESPASPPSSEQMSILNPLALAFLPGEIHQVPYYAHSQTPSTSHIPPPLPQNHVFQTTYHGVSFPMIYEGTTYYSQPVYSGVEQYGQEQQHRPQKILPYSREFRGTTYYSSVTQYPATQYSSNFSEVLQGTAAEPEFEELGNSLGTHVISGTTYFPHVETKSQSHLIDQSSEKLPLNENSASAAESETEDVDLCDAPQMDETVEISTEFDGANQNGGKDDDYSEGEGEDTDIDDGFHHINWLSYQVESKSSTTPATSLVVIMAKSKPYMSSLDLSLANSITLRNAMKWIDPILYYGQPHVLHTMKGSKLQEEVTGSCVKYYSNMGWWKADFYAEDDDHPYTDPLDPYRYNSADTVLNGCYLNHDVPVQDNFWSDSEQAYNKAEHKRVESIRTRRQNGVGKSRLSKVTNVTEFEAIQKSHNLDQSHPSQTIVIKFPPAFAPEKFCWSDEIDDGEADTDTEDLGESPTKSVQHSPVAQCSANFEMLSSNETRSSLRVLDVSPIPFSLTSNLQKRTSDSSCLSDNEDPFLSVDRTPYSQEDNEESEHDTPGNSPVSSPYKRPAPPTPNKARGRRVSFAATVECWTYEVERDDEEIFESEGGHANNEEENESYLSNGNIENDDEDCVLDGGMDAAILSLPLDRLLDASYSIIKAPENTESTSIPLPETSHTPVPALQSIELTNAALLEAPFSINNTPDTLAPQSVDSVLRSLLDTPNSPHTIFHSIDSVLSAMAINSTSTEATHSCTEPSFSSSQGTQSSTNTTLQSIESILSPLVDYEPQILELSSKPSTDEKLERSPVLPSFTRTRRSLRNSSWSSIQFKLHKNQQSAEEDGQTPAVDGGRKKAGLRQLIKKVFYKKMNVLH